MEGRGGRGGGGGAACKPVVVVRTTSELGGVSSSRTTMEWRGEVAGPIREIPTSRNRRTSMLVRYRRNPVPVFVVYRFGSLLYPRPPPPTPMPSGRDWPRRAERKEGSSSSAGLPAYRPESPLPRAPFLFVRSQSHGDTKGGSANATQR